MRCSFDNSKAIALIRGGEENAEISGRVEFYKRGNRVLVVANIKGLPKTESGFFGFHIHEGTACKGEDFADSKGHFNPENTPHPEHSGDLPPLLSCEDTAHLEVLTDRFKIGDIIGRTVIIHNSPDDFTSQPSGNAGRKIACGVIKKA